MQKLNDSNNMPCPHANHFLITAAASFKRANCGMEVSDWLITVIKAVID